MTKDTFYNLAASNYNKLVNYFTQRGYERADAEDYVGQWVVWGLEKEWKDDAVHGFNDMVRWILCHIKDTKRVGMNANEIVLGFEQDTDDEHTEVCDYDFSHLFTETNERTQDEFDSLATSLIGDRETEAATKAIRERLSILTDRQLDIVYLIEQGMNGTEAAAHLGITQQGVSKTMGCIMDRIHGAYPELAPRGRAWTKEEIDAQLAETGRLAAMYEYEKPHVNRYGFPFDKFEDDTRQCMGAHHECTLHSHYIEPDIDIATQTARAIDAYLSAGCNTKAAQMGAVAADPICYQHTPRPASPSTKDEQVKLIEAIIPGARVPKEDVGQDYVVVARFLKTYTLRYNRNI